jgi:hypothetical protein
MEQNNVDKWLQSLGLLFQACEPLTYDCIRDKKESDELYRNIERHVFYCLHVKLAIKDGVEPISWDSWSEKEKSFNVSVKVTPLYTDDEISDKLKAINDRLENDLSSIDNLKQVRVSLLGKKGMLCDVLKLLYRASPEKRKFFSEELNKINKRILDLCSEFDIDVNCSCPKTDPSTVRCGGPRMDSNPYEIDKNELDARNFKDDLVMAFGGEYPALKTNKQQKDILFQNLEKENKKVLLDSGYLK